MFLYNSILPSGLTLATFLVAASAFAQTVTPTATPAARSTAPQTTTATASPTPPPLRANTDASANPSTTAPKPLANPRARPLRVTNKKNLRRTKPQPYVRRYRRSFTLGYFSWYEPATVSTATQSTTTNAAMFGNSLGFQWEHYFPNSRWTFGVDTTFYYGNANVGQSGTTPSYELVDQNWWGLGVQVPVGYRVSRLVSTTLAPMIIYRSLSLPADPSSGATATLSGSFAYGAVWQMKLQYSPSWDVRTQLGVVMKTAQTYWMIAIGYSL